MGLFASLNTSTAGMIAASRATNTVSNNIANQTTIGYKRSDSAFQDIVAQSLYTSGKTTKAGGVTSSQLLRATEQGSVQQTSSTTDAAISGQGFFAVKDSIDPDAEFLYTRNGQFDEYAIRSTPDANALVQERQGEQTFLRNSAGYFLYAWPLDADGAVVGGGSDPSALVPAEVSLFETQSLPTSAIDLSLNLDAGEEDFNPHLLTTAQSLPAIGKTNANFTRSISVFDPLGNERQVTFEFRKITGPMAQFTSNIGSTLDSTDTIIDANGNTPGIIAGDTLSIANGTETLSVQFVNAPADTSLNQASTLQELTQVINNFTGVAGTTQQFEARVSDAGQLLVQSALPSEALDITASSATVLGSTGFNFVADPVDGDYSYAPDFDTAATPSATGPYPDQALFPAISDTDGANTQGWWEVAVLIPDTTDPTGTSNVELTRGLLNFTGTGSLNATLDANGEAILDLSTTPIDFDPATTGDETSISVNMTNFSQFSGDYNVIQAEQNGAGIGLRTNVSISSGGIITAEFSNGIEVDIYQIPLAMFNNPNGLIQRSGAAFSESEQSGSVRMEANESGGAGAINGAAIENSNVDISNEFSYLIVNQRTFGLNGQVINAVDEMTQTLSRLKQ